MCTEFGVAATAAHSLAVRVKKARFRTHAEYYWTVGSQVHNANTKRYSSMFTVFDANRQFVGETAIDRQRCSGDPGVRLLGRTPQPQGLRRLRRALPGPFGLCR